ncbi:carboxymuconolactone decarboxylase family protein [Noviherbaspirillum malthae]|jgi:4-carboxymuconolactone decarboxylase|uniref:carboxymuconolactone decarboxylase family protein n=1 Tax=Noviherbaspirillum malthae TaxID=1260987 RepID=UPI00188F4BCC|nr:carboxymuconolactone decarboxylase family protein [Noviherbaspirillum malthae]
MEQHDKQHGKQHDRQYEDGLQKRKQTMGEDYVERAFANADEFTMPLQDFITRNAWGTVWCRDGLDMKTRSLVTVSMLTALGRAHELKGHLRGALNNGATPDELREVLLHAAVYCGAPLAVDAFRIAQEVVADWKAARSQQPPA